MRIGWSFMVAAAILAWAPPAPAAPTTASDWEQATRLAKESRKTRLVLLTGCDWDPPSKRALSLLTDSTFLAAADGCILVHIDHPDQPDEQQKALLEKNKGFNQASYHYPALLAIDADDQTLGTADGLTPDAPRWAGVVAAWLEKARTRDALLARAEKATGTARAELLGAALDALDFDVARRNGKWIDALKKADEHDASGYVFKYTFNPYLMGEHEVAKVGNQPEKLRETLAKTEKHLANRLLTTEQKQQLYALRYGCFQRLGDMPEAQRALQAAISLDAASDTAQGAARLLARLKKRVRFDASKKALEANPRDGAALQTLLDVADVADLEKLPPFQAPPGTLVNEPIAVSFSSASRQWGEPWRHALLTQAVYRGNFHTESDVRPWVKLKLPRAQQIGGIVVFPAGPRDRLIPLTIEISLDGQTWKEVARQAGPFEQVVVDLSQDRPRAEWVRVSRDDARREFFHLSNILVYAAGSP